jgi:hypothetical protein
MSCSVLAVCALVSTLANCSGTQPSPASSPALTASASPSSFDVLVREEDFQVSFSLDGSTVDGVGVPLQIPHGYFLRATANVGSTVVEGQQVGSLEPDTGYFRDLELRAASSAIDEFIYAQELARDTVILAPISGILQRDGTSWSIQSLGVDVRVNLTPSQLLRLYDTPLTGTASVDTLRGRRTFSCESLWLSLVGEHAVYCRLPNRAETISGLDARLEVSTEVISDALVVPNPYIGYSEGDDSFFVEIETDGSERRVPVNVGATNGVVSVVYGDVTQGDLLIPLAAS